MNNIALFKNSIALLDEVYKNAALTADLDGAPELVKAGANANELILPMIDMQGLGDYDRNSGYVNGDVTLTNETVKCNFDRGRMFNVDAMDDEETAGVAFGKLSGEFIRTKVVPELDAFRFATYASKEGVTVATGNLKESDPDIILAKLTVAVTAMDEAEVPFEGRILYITPTLKNKIDTAELVTSKAILERFEKVVTVPQTRFYSKIEQFDGKTGGKEAGGYVKAADGKDINFMIVHKAAPIQFQKHTVPKIVTPEANQTSDGWKFGYRTVGIADVYENKTAGIYVSVAE
jgi:hypothetical protein